MCNLDRIARMAMNGWPVIPAVPGEKKTYYHWSTVARASYNFGEVFKGQPENCNTAVLTEDTVAVVDFDAHGPEPNGLTVYYKLLESFPAGIIDEQTQSGGHHVYFKGVPGGPYVVTMDGVNVEILCGRKLCYCWPSTTEKGAYKIVSSANHLNTKPEQLPPLPDVFARPPPPAPKPVRRVSYMQSGGLTNDDADVLVDALVDSYLSRAREGERHKRGWILACTLAGHDILGESDVYRGVAMFFRRCKPEATEKEVRDVVAWGIGHPDPAPPTPWSAIYDARARRAVQRLKAGGTA